MFSRDLCVSWGHGKHAQSYVKWNSCNDQWHERQHFLNFGNIQLFFFFFLSFKNFFLTCQSWENELFHFSSFFFFFFIVLFCHEYEIDIIHHDFRNYRTLYIMFRAVRSYRKNLINIRYLLFRQYHLFNNGLTYHNDVFNTVEQACTQPCRILGLAGWLIRIPW